MSEPQVHQERVSVVSDMIESVGDTVHQEAVETTEQDDPVKILACSRGGNQYLVTAVQGQDYFSVQFEYSLLGEYIRTEIQDRIGDDADLSDVQITPEIQESAKGALVSDLNGLSEEQVYDIRLKLVQMLASPPVGFSLSTIDDVRPHGFSVSKKIFPYEDGFATSDFEEAVQGIVTVGFPARNFLQRIFGFLSEDVGTNPEGGSEDRRRDPTFQ